MYAPLPPIGLTGVNSSVIPSYHLRYTFKPIFFVFSLAYVIEGKPVGVFTFVLIGFLPFPMGK